MRILKILVLVTVLGGLAALAIYAAHRSERTVRSLTVDILRTIPRAFLVLEARREVAVASTDAGSIIWGPRIGQATASRQIHLGIDLDKISPNDIVVAGRRVAVHIPAPAVLDTAIDYSTVRLFTKRSGFMLLRDLAAGRSIERELLDLLSETPPEYTGEDLRAQRQIFVDRLNRGAVGLFSTKGLSIEFR